MIPTALSLFVGLAQSGAGEPEPHLLLVVPWDTAEALCGVRVSRWREVATQDALRMVECAECRRQVSSWS